MNGGGDINALGLLPDKLKTELALHVNLETLKKVFCVDLADFLYPINIQPVTVTALLVNQSRFGPLHAC